MWYFIPAVDNIVMTSVIILQNSGSLTEQYKGGLRPMNCFFFFLRNHHHSVIQIC